MLFFGPFCYSSMLQTTSDYALDISRLLFFIKINFTKQVTQYHSFSRISTIMSVLIIQQHQILSSLGENCPAAPQHIYMCTYQATPTRLASRYFLLNWPAVHTYHGTGTVIVRGSRVCTRLTIISVFPLPFIPA